MKRKETKILPRYPFLRVHFYFSIFMSLFNFLREQAIKNSISVVNQHVKSMKIEDGDVMMKEEEVVLLHWYAKLQITYEQWLYQ